MSAYLVERIEGLANVEVVTGVEISALEGEDGHARGDALARPRLGRRDAARAHAISSRSSAPSPIPTGSPPRASSSTRAASSAPAPTPARAGCRSKPAGRGVFAVGDVRAGSVKRVAAAVGDGAQVVAVAPRLSRRRRRNSRPPRRFRRHSIHASARSKAMAGRDDISEALEVIGADGVHLGTVDKVDGDRIKLTKTDSGQGSHEGHHHYISLRPRRRGRGRQGAPLGQCRRRGDLRGRGKTPPPERRRLRFAAAPVLIAAGEERDGQAVLILAALAAVPAQAGWRGRCRRRRRRAASTIRAPSSRATYAALPARSRRAAARPGLCLFSPRLKRAVRRL